jgi:hypothetical protein
MTSLRRAAWLVASCGALSLVSEAVGAQAPARSGFWLEGAWGAGTVRSACSACAQATVASGSSAHLRVGGALSPTALIGVEIVQLRSANFVLTEGGLPVDTRSGSIAPVVLWYPGGTGLFLKGGLGLSKGTFTIPSTSGEILTTSRTGSVITFGLGFDLGIVRWLALTASLGMSVTAMGDIHLDGAFADDLVATAYEAGFGVAIR